MVAGLRKVNLTKSKWTRLAETHSLLRRELQNEVVKLVLPCSINYFEILPATLDPKSSRKLLKILESKRIR